MVNTYIYYFQKHVKTTSSSQRGNKSISFSKIDPNVLVVNDCSEFIDKLNVIYVSFDEYKSAYFAFGNVLIEFIIYIRDLY